jgi:short-subunit dehydrogenase involved in D-alanine esterification of teichoic acids
MAPLYKKALVIGATSGIGWALAEKLVANGTKVIVVGRRRERLDAFVAEHKDATALTLDVMDLASIPAFAKSIVEQHPDLDCIVLNSGIQRAFDFSKPDSVDLSVLDQELMTNYTSYVHLIKSFLPHLQRIASTEDQTAHLIFISATLGLVPGLIRTPNYNASKAALHSFIMALRQQLFDAGYSRLRVVEVFPPAVQTELHDEKHQPDLVGGGEIGIPLVQFNDELYLHLQKGMDNDIAIGHGAEWFKEGGFEHTRQSLFRGQVGALKTALSRFLKK